MIIYSWPWGYRRSYFWLPGLYSVTLAVWVLFVWPFILVFWMAVWGFALVGWLIIEFYLGLYALGQIALEWRRGQVLHLDLARLGRWFWRITVTTEPSA